MRIFREMLKSAIVASILLLSIILIPVESSAQQKEKVRISYIDGGFQFGEPGHDPFSRGMEPGGEAWRNRVEEREIFSIPGSGNGNGGQQGSCVSREKEPGLIVRIFGTILFVSLRPLI